MSNQNQILKTEYPVIDGIIRTIKDEDITGRNKKYMDLYNGFAKFYTLVGKVVSFFYSIFKRKLGNPIDPFLADLGIKNGDRVLEVSVGTGDNLQTLPKDIDFYGLDISMGMLKQCQKRYRNKRKITLVHGMAECLPFSDETFDVVFHIGGINFFNDRAKAIQEMIRVAKPGAPFLIVDETEKAAKDGERIPLARRFFKNRDEVIVPPVDLVPKEMLDVKLSYLCGDSFYAITFKKP